MSALWQSHRRQIRPLNADRMSPIASQTLLRLLVVMTMTMSRMLLLLLIMLVVVVVVVVVVVMLRDKATWRMPHPLYSYPQAHSQ